MCSPSAAGPGSREGLVAVWFRNVCSLSCSPTWCGWVYKMKVAGERVGQDETQNIWLQEKE